MFFAGITPDQLRSIPLFEGLGDEDLGVIAQRSLFIGAHPGMHLVRQGESGFDFYVILMGRAEVRVNGSVVAELGPGDVFGEMALLGGGSRNADVVATDVMSLITMMVWDFRATLSDYPQLKQRLEALARQRADA